MATKKKAKAAKSKTAKAKPAAKKKPVAKAKPVKKQAKKSPAKKVVKKVVAKAKPLAKKKPLAKVKPAKAVKTKPAKIEKVKAVKEKVAKVKPVKAEKEKPMNAVVASPPPAAEHQRKTMEFMDFDLEVQEKRPRGRAKKPKPDSQPRALSMEQKIAQSRPTLATIQSNNTQVGYLKKGQDRKYVKRTGDEDGRTRYSDNELAEFRTLITQKVEDARKELVTLQAQLNSANDNGTDDTASTFKMLEDGSDSLAKEEAGQLAARQKKFIEQLENALIRIENKTYGICRVTGKLIPKERLRAVPHTTQSIEAKLNQYRD